MEESHEDLRNALELEAIRFSQWISDSSRESAEKIQANERSLAARRLALSGARVKAEVDIIFTSIEEVAEKAIALRQELGARVPVLLEQVNVNALGEKLDRSVEGCLNAVRARAKNPPYRGAIGDVIVPEADRRAYALKARLKQKLAALPLEASLGVHRTAGTTLNTFNISNNTIANLNLGNVVGDLNSSIQQLSSDGQKVLADEFRKLAEAVASSEELQADMRRELLEHLAVVSEESAKPPTQRKMGPLKSSMAAVKSGIAVAAQLFAIYQGLEHALRVAGIIQ